MEFKDKVKLLIDKGLEENPSLFLIDWSISSSNAIKIIIDGDNNIGVEDCVALSRAVEHHLDREEVDFSLEVTSCGIFSPLVNLRQYVKNIGRVLNVKTNEIELEGVLKSVENQTIIIEQEVRKPKPVGKGKITVKEQHNIALTDIKEAKLIIKF